jgi:hypothetical protein
VSNLRVQQSDAVPSPSEATLALQSAITEVLVSDRLATIRTVEASQGPAPLPDKEQARTRALAQLRQSVWDASQFLDSGEIVSYVRAVNTEIEADDPDHGVETRKHADGCTLPLFHAGPCHFED